MATRYGVVMIALIETQPIPAGPRRRHEARVRRFSTNPDLLLRLDSLAVDEHGSRVIVQSVCRDFEIVEPQLAFHARRSPYTGQTEAPRSYLVDRYGAAEVARAEERRPKPLEPTGIIRLGRTTTLMTLAHELGHHLAFALDPTKTPAHGAVWISRFDQVAESIQSMT